MVVPSCWLIRNESCGGPLLIDMKCGDIPALYFLHPVMSNYGQGYPNYNIPPTPAQLGSVILPQTPMSLPLYPGMTVPQPLIQQSSFSNYNLLETNLDARSDDEEEDSTVEYEIVGTKRVKKDEVRLELDKNYNLSDVLTTAILHSQYFKGL